MAAPSPLRIHVVGVGGPGTSAIAIILREMGHEVSGSDVRESALLDSLRSIGVKVVVPHDPGIVAGCDIVTHSAAVRRDNVELVAARDAGITVLPRAAMIGWIAARADTVAVAGTHGKTTTTTLLTLMLRADGRDPGFLIGAEVPQIARSAHWGRGPFVVEADESDSSHRSIKPRATILTNVDVDHLDEHGSFEGLVASFADYLRDVPGPRVVCADDPTAARLAAEYPATTYGLADADVTAEGIVHSEVGTRFVVREGAARHEVSSPLRGLHNVRNFLAAFTMARLLGVDAVTAVDSVRGFRGVRRRFEVRAEDAGATFVDDYAHLPAEIAAVLAAARASGSARRIVAVFQPNRYNRMAVMSDEYRDAFVDADVAVVTDIYASGTDPIPGVTGRLVVDAVRAAHPGARIDWCAERDELVDHVARLVGDGDMCISMGCGDIETFPDEVVARRRDLARGD